MATIFFSINPTPFIYIGKVNKASNYMYTYYSCEDMLVMDKEAGVKLNM